MTDTIDEYSHRLSLKNNIAYESARILMENSIDRLKEKDVNSQNIERSAYKYSRIKLINKQEGGSKINKFYKINYKN